MKPDYNVEETFEDYKNGIDPIFEFVKLQINANNISISFLKEKSSRKKFR